MLSSGHLCPQVRQVFTVMEFTRCVFMELSSSTKVTRSCFLYLKILIIIRKPLSGVCCQTFYPLLSVFQKIPCKVMDNAFYLKEGGNCHSGSGMLLPMFIIRLFDFLKHTISVLFLYARLWMLF